MNECVHPVIGNETGFASALPGEPNRIYIGNQTAFSAERFMEPFEYALASGFDAFEWFPDPKPGGSGWDEEGLTPALRRDIRRAAHARGLRLSVHGQCLISLLREEVDPLLLRDLELARDLGAAVIVLHLNPEAEMIEFARALLEPLRRAAAGGLQIAVENTPMAAPDHFSKLFAALRRLDPPELPQIGMCLDIGHANLCPATRNDYLGYLDQLDDSVPIKHLHVHENWGEADTHLTLFTGPSRMHSLGVQGLLRRLRRRGYVGSVIMEQWPQPPTLLNGARDRLLEMWCTLDEPEQAATSEFPPLSPRIS